MDWPQSFLRPLPTIHPWSEESMGRHLTGMAETLVGTASLTYVQNLVLYVPFQLGAPITVLKMFVYNGITVIGNVDVGIYGHNGVLLVSSGSTAQAGASALQEFDIADTALAAGLYYMAMTCDAATATVFIAGLTAETAAAGGMLGQAATFPLPATATFARTAEGVPVFGLTTRSVI